MEIVKKVEAFLEAEKKRNAQMEEK